MWVKNVTCVQSELHRFMIWDIFIHRQNQELEEKLQKMVTTAEDNKILINSHRTENMTLRENLKDLEVRYECWSHCTENMTF